MPSVNLSNCWKLLRAFLLQRKDETSLSVNAEKRRIGQSAAKPRTGERPTTIPTGSTGDQSLGNGRHFITL